MKKIVKSVLALMVVTASSQVASAVRPVSIHAKISGPASWTVGQPTTVTWSTTIASTCNVRVALNLGTTEILTGYSVALNSNQSAIPGVNLTAGTAVTFTLVDMCSGAIFAAAFPVRIVGGSGPSTPIVAAATVTITPQIRQNIDTACQGVLGFACSTNASYSSIYTAITQLITQSRLASDSSSVMYSYLIPLVSSGPTWKANVVDNAWRGIGCGGTAPESQWIPRFTATNPPPAGYWQTYAGLANLMRTSGCAGASANVAPVAAPAVQYLSVQQMYPGYSQVWGAAAGYATIIQTCPPTTGAVSCARSDLAAYIRSKGTGILQTLVGPPYQSVTGRALDSAHASIITSAYGRNWSGADDLVNYIKTNPAQFPVLTTTVFGGLDAKGCLVNGSGVPLSSVCGNYLVSSSGVHTTGTYNVSLGGQSPKASGFAPSSLLVTNTGVPLILTTSASGFLFTAGIVAQGGGNIVAQGGGNIVAQGGGNIVAQGGGNIVAQGGGNIVAQGGGNFTSINFAAMDALSAARTTGLIDSKGASLLLQNGAGFAPSFLTQFSAATLVGNSGNALISNTNPTGFVGQNGSALNNIYQTSSVSSSPMAYLSVPTSWAQGTPLIITWTATPAATPCANGFQIYLNGKPGGPATAMAVGKSILAATKLSKGTKLAVTLVSGCGGATVSPTYTTTVIQ